MAVRCPPQRRLPVAQRRCSGSPAPSPGCQEERDRKERDASLDVPCRPGRRPGSCVAARWHVALVFLAFAVLQLLRRAPEQPRERSSPAGKPTNTMDGVPGLTQPSTGPGETFVYEFTATNPGGRWYYTHQDIEL